MDIVYSQSNIYYTANLRSVICLSPQCSVLYIKFDIHYIISNFIRKNAVHLCKAINNKSQLADFFLLFLHNVTIFCNYTIYHLALYINLDI